ncbi:MAG: IS5 family transposase [Chloroflexi bacterium]|nr:IS5 family transposase [Chloroflexota bacterium]
MRGSAESMGPMFVYVTTEQFVSKNHPLRSMKPLVDAALSKLDREFDSLYSSTGRPSIPPEYLLRGLVLQFVYSVRSHVALMDRINSDMAFRWFIGLAIDDKIWDQSVFSYNQDRLIKADIGCRFLEEITRQAEKKGLLSNDHFSVDGTLLESLASIKSFRRKDGSDSDKPAGDFKGETFSNKTHQSKTDPDARLYKKSKGSAAKLSVMGHAMTENENGFVTQIEVTHADGKAERRAAKKMTKRQKGSRKKRITVAADKAYDTSDFVEEMRELNVTPHVASKSKGTAVDGRTTRHASYRQSLKDRKKIEEFFGWAKVIAGFRKLRHTGLEKIRFYFSLAAGCFNLVKLRNLIAQT